MRFSVITPNYNGGPFLEKAIKSVISQREHGIELEYIVVDGGSRDASPEILERYKSSIDHLIIENDQGPADAINKGMAVATGDIVSWLNADDFYFPGSLQRIKKQFKGHPDASFCFGKCVIVDEEDEEIRKGITRFKEFFYPLSCRFTFQCINYISQPAVFFRHRTCSGNTTLRRDMVAAWDYDFLLRLWKYGDGVFVPGEPVSAFRWHENSISGRQFKIQFKEELELAKIDAGRFSPQAIIHQGVRWGIVGAYLCMSVFRMFKKDDKP